MSRATLHRRARSIPVTSVDSTDELHPVVCDICGWEGAPQREAWTAARAIARHQTSQRCQDAAATGRGWIKDARKGCDPQRALAGTCTCRGCTEAARDGDLDITDRPRVRRGGVTRWSER